MRKTIDVRPQDEALALGLIDKVMAQRPNQKLGSAGQAVLKINNRTFIITRNKTSYTCEDSQVVLENKDANQP